MHSACSSAVGLGSRDSSTYCAHPDYEAPAGHDSRRCLLLRNTPTRINHQLIYKNSDLESSINISLYNLNVFHPQTKLRTAWGQLIHSAEYNSWLSISNDGSNQTESTVEINFYDESGIILSTSLQIACRSAQTINIKELLENAAVEVSGEYLWYEFESDNHFMTGFSISQNTLSNHCTGEHSF